MPKATKGHKSKPWYDDPEILRRLATVEDLVLAGYRNTEIGHALQVGETTVRRDRERIAELWRKQATDDIVAMRERSVAQFRRLQRLADNEFRNEREKPAMLRVQLDAEREIVKLQGTPAPTRISHDFSDKKLDLENISSEELMKRAQALEALANELMGNEPIELGG